MASKNMDSRLRGNDKLLQIDDGKAF